MAEDKLPQFSEDDDMARARAFWKENGNSIIFGIALGLAGIVGFNYWKNHQQYQAESASALYDQIRSGVNAINALTVAGELKESFPSTVYASLGAFSLAKIFVEEGKYDLAAQELQWALDNANEPAIEHVARLRLAAVHISLNDPQAALDLLDVAEMDSFESRYMELRGDAYIERGESGDKEQGRSAYQNSLDALSANSGYSDLIQLKLNNIGEG